MLGKHSATALFIVLVGICVSLLEGDIQSSAQLKCLYLTDSDLAFKAPPVAIADMAAAPTVQAGAR